LEEGKNAITEGEKKGGVRWRVREKACPRRHGSEDEAKSIFDNKSNQENNDFLTFSANILIYVVRSR